MNNSVSKKMRSLPVGLTLALLTFSAGVVAYVLWPANQQPAPADLALPPCAKPPEYESLSGPCSGVDLSAYARLPTTPYCELVRDPRAYDGRVVRVRGVYVQGKNTSLLYSTECQSELATFVYSEPYFDEEKALNDMIRAGGFYWTRRAEVTALGKFRVVTRSRSESLRDFPLEFSLMDLERTEPVPKDFPYPWTKKDGAAKRPAE